MERFGGKNPGQKISFSKKIRSLGHKFVHIWKKPVTEFYKSNIIRKIIILKNMFSHEDVLKL